MDIPVDLMGSIVGEGEKYFFTVDCPIGIQEHIHICKKEKQDSPIFDLLFKN